MGRRKPVDGISVRPPLSCPECHEVSADLEEFGLHIEGHRPLGIRVSTRTRRGETLRSIQCPKKCGRWFTARAYIPPPGGKEYNAKDELKLHALNCNGLRPKGAPLEIVDDRRDVTRLIPGREKPPKKAAPAPMLEIMRPRLLTPPRPPRPKPRPTPPPVEVARPAPPEKSLRTVAILYPPADPVIPLPPHLLRKTIVVRPLVDHEIVLPKYAPVDDVERPDVLAVVLPPPRVGWVSVRQLRQGFGPRQIQR